MRRNKVTKVNQDGKPIKGTVSAWKKKYPKDLIFDSTQEWQCYKYLLKEKIAFTLQPEIELFPSKSVHVFRENVIKSMIQRKMIYTPDFLITIGKQKIYVEYKGYADPEFKIRWKLFKLTEHIGYIVYTVEEFVTLIDLLVKRNKNGIEEEV